MKKSISQLVKGILQRDVSLHASSISFFFFMAMIPMLILMSAVVPVFGISMSDVTTLFQELLPDDTANLVGDIVREAFGRSGMVLSASALTLLWTSSRGMSALIAGLNVMYDKKETRGFAKLTILSIGYTIALMLFLSGVVHLIISGNVIELLRTVFPQIHEQSGLSTFIEFIILVASGTFLLGLVYRFLPSGKSSFSRQLPGAFFVSAIWVLFSMGIRVYIRLFNSFASLYGSLAAVILILFWFYWFFFLLLVGGYANAHQEQILPDRFHAFYRKNRRAAAAVSGLFAFGFSMYLCECYMNRRLYEFTFAATLPVLFRISMILSWQAAMIIALKSMKAAASKKHIVCLLAVIAGNLVFVRRSLFPNVLVYLIVLTLWNLVILLMCLHIMFSAHDVKPG